MPDDAPRASAELSSPACFAHEADDAYMGYLTPPEADAAVRAVLAMDHADGSAPDLRDAIDALEGRLTEPRGSGRPSAASLDPDDGASRHAARARCIRSLAPKIADEALRAALVRLACAHERAAAVKADLGT